MSTKTPAMSQAELQEELIRRAFVQHEIECVLSGVSAEMAATAFEHTFDKKYGWKWDISITLKEK